MLPGLSLGDSFTNVPGGTNYNDQSGDATVTISKKPATVSATANGKTYGAAEPTLSGTLSGFLSGDGVTATYSRVAGESASPPTYHITATPSAAAGVLANYTITNAGAAFTINKAPLTVTGKSASRPFGTPNPDLSAPLIITGFKLFRTGRLRWAPRSVIGRR